MSKYVPVILAMIISIVLSGCRNGDVSNVETIIGPSAVYTQAELEAAVEVVITHFQKNFEGCTLTQIVYEEALSDRSARGWAEQYEADQAIVLLSAFDVDSSGGDGSLNPNSTYKGWNWILVRDTGGRWRHVDHGY